MLIKCVLELDKKRQRKWSIYDFDKTDESIKTFDPPLRTNVTVSIGSKYVDKLKFKLGDIIQIDSVHLFYRTGYYIYNAPIFTLKKIETTEIINPISLENDGFYLSNQHFNILHRNIKNQINTMMLGPTGSGKTEVIQLICEKLGIGCAVYDMGSQHDPIAGLLGVHRLEKGESIFDYSKFVSDVQKPGVIVLDELNRAPHSCLNILFPCLDSRRMLPIEIASSKCLRNVLIHPECTFIATANVGFEYTGTLTIDKALLNRFFLVEMPYLDVENESQMLIKRAGIDNHIADMISKLASEIRLHAINGKISQSISTRETISIAKLINDGWETLEAIKTCVLPIYDKNDREFIMKLIMSK